MPRNVDGDVKLRLKLSFGFTTTADKCSVFLNWNIQSFCDLALSLKDEGFNAFDDLVNNIASSFNSDPIAIGILLGELDSSSLQSSILWATGFDDDVA